VGEGGTQIHKEDVAEVPGSQQRQNLLFEGSQGTSAEVDEQVGARNQLTDRTAMPTNDLDLITIRIVGMARFDKVDPVYHALEMTIFERVRRDLPVVGFDPDHFGHMTVWHPEWKPLRHELRAQRDIHFGLGPYDLAVAKGQSFWTGRSFKYSDGLIARAAVNAGFDKPQLFGLPGSTMRVGVCTARARQTKCAEPRTADEVSESVDYRSCHLAKTSPDCWRP
jgi:hypothetical protein